VRWRIDIVGTRAPWTVVTVVVAVAVVIAVNAVVVVVVDAS
jgi:hypothetical protein